MTIPAWVDPYLLPAAALLGFLALYLWLKREPEEANKLSSVEWRKGVHAGRDSGPVASGAASAAVGGNNSGFLSTGPITDSTFHIYPPTPAEAPLPPDGPPEYLPMSEAATRAYEEMRLAKGELLAFVEQKAAKRDFPDVLPVCADKLVLSYGLPLFGERYPSTRREKIDPAEEFFGTDFSHDASQIVDGEFRPIWGNLVVRADDLSPILNAIKDGRTAELLALQRFVSLREAAKIGVEQTEGTPLESFLDHPYDGAPEDRIDFLINLLLDYDDRSFDVVAEKLPSSHPRVVRPRGRLFVVPGTNNLAPTMFAPATYANGKITLKELHRFIERLKQTSNGLIP